MTIDEDPDEVWDRFHALAATLYLLYSDDTTEEQCADTVMQMNEEDKATMIAFLLGVIGTETNDWPRSLLGPRQDMQQLEKLPKPQPEWLRATLIKMASRYHTRGVAGLDEVIDELDVAQLKVALRTHVAMWANEMTATGQYQTAEKLTSNPS